MKKIVVLLVIFLSLNISAQRSRGVGGRGQTNNPKNQKNNQSIRLSTHEIAGIFYYDIDDVIKKIKIKEEKKQNTVKKLLKNYNFKIKEIALLNSKKLTDLDVIVKSTSSFKDNQTRIVVRKKVEEIIQPISKKINENKLKLNKFLASGLSKKQFKKWIKYQKNQQQSLLTKRSQRNNQNSNQQRRKRQ